MSLNFTQLMAFRAVAEAGSVGGGAERLMVSQPAVSKQLKLLERELGIKLFERTARGVIATEAGRLLIGYVGRIFALTDEAERAVGELQGLQRGTLAVGASPTLGTYFLPAILVRFRRRFPKIQLTLEIDSGQTLHRKLSDGLLDLGFSEVESTGECVDAFVFMRDRFVAIAAAGHPLSRGKRVSLQRLCVEPFVIRETGSNSKSLVERWLTSRGLAINPAVSVGSTEAMKHAVAAGMGVAIVSSFIAESGSGRGSVQPLRVKGLSLSRPLYQLQQHGRELSKAATAFLCLVRHAVAARNSQT